MKKIVYEDLKVGQEVVTRDGRKGRVLCTDLKSRTPIIVAILNPNNNKEDTMRLYKNGNYWNSGTECDNDIFLPSEKGYVNIFRRYKGVNNNIAFFCIDAGIFSSEQEAKDYAYRNPDYIKTIEVEI